MEARRDRRAAVITRLLVAAALLAVPVPAAAHEQGPARASAQAALVLGPAVWALLALLIGGALAGLYLVTLKAPAGRPGEPPKPRGGHEIEAPGEVGSRLVDGRAGEVHMSMERRRVLGLGLAAGAAALAGAAPAGAGAPPRARVVVVKGTGTDTAARADAVRRALDLLAAEGLSGRHVVVKPNFNSADAFPGSTHPGTLAALVAGVGRAGARRVTVADRSGMGDTREVMDTLGIPALGRRVGFEAVALDALPSEDWISKPLPGSHWLRGVLYPRLLEEAEAIVSTCCLKTHRFGGQFTLSLKNSVGAVGKWGTGGYNYMWELHASLRSQRLMIAEINTLYRPALVLLDALEGFVDGGPERGTRAHPGVMLAGTDRVAIDAVGVALLRLHGTTGAVAAGPIFAQEQIARAVELGLGVGDPGGIDLVTDDAAGQDVIRRLRPVLMA